MFGKPILPISALAVAFAFTVTGFATTWSPTKVACPLCGTEDEFCTIASYGSYIYDWPSKYQYIYWPITDERVIYACRKCSFSCFMWDFKSVPEEKKGALKKALQGTVLPPPIEKKGRAPAYASIPMDARLAAAEKVYTVLGLSEEKWGLFYRAAAYHYDDLKMNEKARACREKALALAENLIARKENAGRLKELHLITGAMRYFLGKEKEAVADFRKALESPPFKHGKLDEKQNANKDKYLTELLKKYIQQIEKRETQKPK